MKQNGRGNALLVELLIVVLFFMLAATTLMEIFGAAKANSTRAGANNAALMQAQNMAERLYAADDVEAALKELGFTLEGDVWRSAKDEYELVASYNIEQTAGGVLRNVDISTTHNGEELFSLPATRYLSGEVQP